MNKTTARNPRWMARLLIVTMLLFANPTSTFGHAGWRADNAHHAHDCDKGNAAAVSDHQSHSSQHGHESAAQNCSCCDQLDSCSDYGAICDHANGTALAFRGSAPPTTMVSDRWLHAARPAPLDGAPQAFFRPPRS